MLINVNAQQETCHYDMRCSCRNRRGLSLVCFQSRNNELLSALSVLLVNGIEVPGVWYLARTTRLDAFALLGSVAIQSNDDCFDSVDCLAFLVSTIAHECESRLDGSCRDIALVDSEKSLICDMSIVLIYPTLPTRNEGWPGSCEVKLNKGRKTVREKHEISMRTM
jgi:hypothetical protein